MALDRQRILGELGSVMHQLQSADCGCLGKLFGSSQQTAPATMGSPLPTCGGCRRACCHGHGCAQQRYSSTNMNQAAPNMNYTHMEGSNPPQQPMPGNMCGFGPQIVNMMRGDHSNTQNMTGQPKEMSQGHMQGQMQGPLTGPMVIDAPQSPHGKVGLTPFTPPMVQQGQFNADIMNQGDVARMAPWSQQNNNTNLAAHQMATPQVNPWQQQSMGSNPSAQQTSNYSNPHGQHSQGIAKFNKMFPGVKQGMGGDLGFDPMAIAIQMNPDNHLQSAMDTMNKIINGNKGMGHIKPPAMQPGVTGNTMNQSPPVLNGAIQQNAGPQQTFQSNVSPVAYQQQSNVCPVAYQQQSNVSPVAYQQQSNASPVAYQQQNNINPVAYQQPAGQYVGTKQDSPNQQYTNAYGQPVPQQQHIYAAAIDPNQQVRYGNPQQSDDQKQYGQQQINDSYAPNLPIIQQEAMADENQMDILPESNGYPNQAPVQQKMKDPIFPVDTSRNVMNMPTKQRINNNYGYNTLGQPVEMLPAKMYHPPEPSLPQTLSPQPDPVKAKSTPIRGMNVKATISKTSLMGNKPVGKTPSRAQLQQIYNQYKGSHSFTQQNVRRPNEGTCSAGKLNLPQVMRAPPVPVERVGGDTVVNNPVTDQNQISNVQQVIEQIGDVPAAKPGGDSAPMKDAPVPVRKSRNGLQDVVFSSYPTSAAWTFHGHGRPDYSPTRYNRHRPY